MRESHYEGRTFEVRALKRKEVKELKKAGFVISNLNPENADDCLDRVFSMVFSPEDIEYIDNMPNHKAIALWRDILKETYGAKDEEKNS
jgi:hypothetical protein